MSAAFEAARARNAEMDAIVSECERSYRTPSEGKSMVDILGDQAFARLQAMRELFGPGKRWTWAEGVDYYRAKCSSMGSKYRACRDEAQRKAK